MVEHKKLRIIIISDGTGETATAVSRAAITQFPGRDVYFTRYKNIRTKDQIEAIFTEAAVHHDLIIYTIVSPELREFIFTSSKEKHVRSLDLLGPTLTAFANYFEQEPSSQPGLLHAINDDYFQRKHIVTDSAGKEFEDNDERALFFARGVIETVKKLRWAPDIVHCHGWMTSLVPVYLRSIYNDDPLFHNYKIIYSVYNNDFKTPFRSTFADKLRFDGIDGESLKLVKKPDFINVSKLAIKYSDAIIIGSEDINGELSKYIQTITKPVLTYRDENQYVDAYNDFYDQILS